MLSRIADSVYWMSRYFERVGNTARLLEINSLYLIEAEDALAPAAQWKPLLSITATEEAYEACYGTAEVTADRVVDFMVREKENANSIHGCLRSARENARVVRDRISKEMWETMNETWLDVDRQLAAPLAPERAAAFYAQLRKDVARFHGVTANTMMRGEAWAFYILGGFIERADMTARMLDVKYHLLLPDLSLVGSPLDFYQWAALLKSISGFEAFRRKYHAGLRPVDVAEFVLFEPEFPRSVRFSMDRIRHALGQLGGIEPGSATEAVTRRIAERLGEATAEDVFKEGLHEFLEDFLDQVAALHDALRRDYFEARLTEQPCAT